MYSADFIHTHLISRLSTIDSIIKAGTDLLERNINASNEMQFTYRGGYSTKLEIYQEMQSYAEERKKVQDLILFYESIQ